MRLPIAVMIVLFMISVIIDIAIRKDIKSSSNKNIYTRIYLVSAIICWLFLIGIYLYPKKDSTHNIQTVMWMLYTYLTIYISKIVYVIVSYCGRIPLLWKSKRIKTGVYFGLPLAIVTFLLMWWGAFVTRKQLHVERINIASAKIPKTFNGYKIVQFSDLHVGTWGNDTIFVSNLVDTINSLQPDLILFTGDIVNRQTSELAPFLKVLSRLKARDGVLSVLGNHDYGDYIEWRYASEREENNILLAMWQRQMGWELLNNEYRIIKKENDSIAIIGVENWGEPPFKQYGNLRKAILSDREKGNISHLDSAFTILMSHNPEHWNREVSKDYNIDLTLSGHTHAMQFLMQIGNYKWSPAAWKYPQWGGLYERNVNNKLSRLYVNIGSGEVAMPFRIGAIPEITLIILENRDTDE